MLQSQESQTSPVMEMQVDLDLKQLLKDLLNLKAGHCPGSKMASPPEKLIVTRRTGTFYNIYEALEPGLSTDEAGGNPSGERGHLGQQCLPRIMTSSVMGGVAVIGDALLREMENLICRLDPAPREVCCLPGARVRDITGKFYSLIRPSDPYWLFKLAVIR